MLFFHTALSLVALTSTARAEDGPIQVFVDPKGESWSLDTGTPCVGPCTFHLRAGGMHKVQMGSVREDVWFSRRTEIRYRPRIAPLFYGGAVLTTFGVGGAALGGYGLLKHEPVKTAGDIGAVGTFLGVSIGAAIAGAIFMVVGDETLQVRSFDPKPAPSEASGRPARSAWAFAF